MTNAPLCNAAYPYGKWMAGRDGAMLLSLEQGFEIGAKVVGERYAAALRSTERVQ